MIVAGIDCGSKYTKCVIMKDGEIMHAHIIETEFEPKSAITSAIDSSLSFLNEQALRLEGIGITGLDCNELDYDVRRVTDLHALAAGALFFAPDIDGVLEIGEEETKALKLDLNGNILDFAVNDKCAAGTGAFLNSMARALESTVEDLSEMATYSKTLVPLNSQCTIFAESEVIGLIHSGTNENDIAAAVLRSVATRLATLTSRVNLQHKLVVLGGISKSNGLISILEKYFENTKVIVPELSHFGSAIGAAIVITRVLES